MKLIYQSGKTAYIFTSLRSLLAELPYKRYDSITPSLGRGIILTVGDDKDYLIVPFQSRNRVCRYLNKRLVSKV